MQKILMIVCYVLIAKINIAQNIEIVSKSNVKLQPYDKAKGSVFIHPKMDTTLFQFVSAFEATGKDSMTAPGDLFLLIKTQGRKLGANCFKLKSYVYDTLNRPFISIDAYYGSESTLAINSSNYETNVVFIFCPEKIGSDSFSLKINNETKTFNTTTYLKYTIAEGEELKISKGGFTGAKVRLKYKKEKAPIYLMVMGFGLGGGPLPPHGTIGISFNTGQIRELTEDSGQFFVQVLKQSD
jgi:hypothetical protein